MQLEGKNGEGSVVSFIMPSTFPVDRQADLVIQLTAVDIGGKRATREIRLQSLSRRQGALWSEISMGRLDDTGRPSVNSVAMQINVHDKDAAAAGSL